MEPTKITNLKNSKPIDNSTSDATKLVEVTTSAAKQADPKIADAPAATASPKDAKSAKKDEKRAVISVVFPNTKTVRALKLLANLEGVSIASIVIAAVTKAVNKRLPAALETLKNDLEG